MPQFLGQGTVGSRFFSAKRGNEAYCLSCPEKEALPAISVLPAEKDSSNRAGQQGRYLPGLADSGISRLWQTGIMVRGRYEITITSQTISLQPLMPSTVCDVTVIHLQRLSPEQACGTCLSKPSGPMNYGEIIDEKLLERGRTPFKPQGLGLPARLSARDSAARLMVSGVSIHELIGVCAGALKPRIARSASCSMQ